MRTTQKPHAGRCNAYLLMYQKSRNEGDFVASESACFRALTLQKEQQRGWIVRVALGALYLEAGQHDKAILELEQANALHPNSADVYQYLGLALANKGDKSRAEAMLRGAIELEPSYWSARLALTEFLYDEGRYEEAELVTRQLLDIAPQHYKGLSQLGSALYMQGRHSEAGEYWNLAQVQAPPEEWRALAILQSSLGLAYYYDGNFEDAMKAHERAIELVPDDHRPWGRLAESARAAGQLDRERSAYERAIELAHERLNVNPNDWESLGLLGLYYGFVDNPEAARRFSDQMIQTVPTNATARYFDALVNLAIRDFDGAFAAAEVATDLGFSREMLSQDPDLKALAQVNPNRYQQLLEPP